MGEIPFKDVMIHATILTETGKRMSKSLGTGIDPMNVIGTLGADVLRWTLLSQTGENQDIKYSERKNDEARNFANKIWNATRFVLMNSEGVIEDEAGDLEDVDRWLLSRLYRTERIVRDSFEGFDMQAACQALYRFFWSEVCDWYIEVSKARLASSESRQTPQWILIRVIEAFLIMLHPVMPHVTEELYAHLPLSDKAPLIMQAKWPVVPDSYLDEAAEKRIERAFDVTRALRAVRAESGITPRAQVPVAYYEGDLAGVEDIVRTQAWIEDLRQGKPAEAHLSTTLEGLDLHLPVAGHVNAESELARLGKDRDKLTAELLKLDQRLDDPNFTSRAKPEIVARERERAAEVRESLSKLETRAAMFGSGS